MKGTPVPVCTYRIKLLCRTNAPGLLIDMRDTHLPSGRLYLERKGASLLQGTSKNGVALLVEAITLPPLFVKLFPDLVDTETCTDLKSR